MYIDIYNIDIYIDLELYCNIIVVIIIMVISTSTMHKLTLVPCPRVSRVEFPANWN